MAKCVQSPQEQSRWPMMLMKVSTRFPNNVFYPNFRNIPVMYLKIWNGMKLPCISIKPLFIYTHCIKKGKTVSFRNKTTTHLWAYLILQETFDLNFVPHFLIMARFYFLKISLSIYIGNHKQFNPIPVLHLSEYWKAHFNTIWYW